MKYHFLIVLFFIVVTVHAQKNESSEYHKAVIYLDTAESFIYAAKGSFGVGVLERCDENKAVCGDAQTELRTVDANTHIFLTYSLGKKVMKQYKKAVAYFQEKNIKDPKLQLVVVPAPGGLSEFQAVYIFKHETALAAQKKRRKLLLADAEEIIEDSYGPFLEHFKNYLMFNKDAQWYDTQLGLYYITVPDKKQKARPLLNENFTAINPLMLERRINSNEWINHMETIFNPAAAVHWLIGLYGHGSEGDFFPCIAGLSETSLYRILHFFNEMLIPTLLYVNSCYCTAALVRALFEKQNGSRTLNFTLLTPIANQDTVLGWDTATIQTYLPAWYNDYQKLIYRNGFAYLNNYLQYIHKSMVENKVNNGGNVLPVIELIKNIRLNPAPSLIIAHTQEPIIIA